MKPMPDERCEFCDCPVSEDDFLIVERPDKGMFICGKKECNDQVPELAEKMGWNLDTLV